MIKQLFGGLAGGLLAAGGVMAAGTLSASGSHDYPEAKAYDVSQNVSSDVDAAFERATANGKLVMLVMGANWCHDSRALAGWLETERLAKLVDEKYELVFINVGMPQSGDGHNLEIARRFGVDDLPGTPNVLIVTAEGELLNADTATTWRNAASRSEDEIYGELSAVAQKSETNPR